MRVIRRHRPEVITCYDPYGGYGHPDHIQVHRIGTAAFFGAADIGRFPPVDGEEPWQPLKLYWSTWPRERSRQARRAMAAIGRLPAEEAEQEPDHGAREDDITTRLDVREWFDRKWRGGAGPRHPDRRRLLVPDAAGGGSPRGIRAWRPSWRCSAGSMRPPAPTTCSAASGSAACPARPHDHYSPSHGPLRPDQHSRWPRRPTAQGPARGVHLPRQPIRSERAVGWAKKGADALFVVDLDAAAYRDIKNRPIIREIVEAVDIPVHAAGGVRSAADVACMLEDVGVAQVGMGTAAINNQVQFWELCRDNPGRIFVSLDVLPNEELATRGWTAGSGRYLEEVLIELSSAGAAGFHVQQANRDALVEPSNLGILAETLAVVTEPVIASGGARDIADLTSLRDLCRDERCLAGRRGGPRDHRGPVHHRRGQGAAGGEPADRGGPVRRPPYTRPMHIGFLNPQGNFDAADSYWTEHPDFGGQLVYVKQVALALGEMGHRVDILTRRIVDDDWPPFRGEVDCLPGRPQRPDHPDPGR